MSRKIFLIGNNDELTPMQEKAYLNEDRFQELLEKYPDLLAGDQIDEENPRRWLLISREVGIPGEEETGSRWSLDHLFLDQDAIPTLVEVKRSSDTRIRREVVGQMLDYAANAIMYWPVEDIKAKFEAKCEMNKQVPELLIRELIGVEQDKEYDTKIFWENVRTNLKAGKIRLVFVADEIPKELKSIVEFLNIQMNPAEVLAVEVKQFVGEDIKTLVPKIIGNTSESDKKKTGRKSGGKQWDEVSFKTTLKEHCSDKEVKTVGKIINWAHKSKLRFWWGKGSINGSWFPLLDHNDNIYWLFSIWTYGRIEIQFQWMKSREVYDDPQKRRQLLKKFNKITKVSIPENAIDRRPAINISVLNNDIALKKFLDVWEEYIAEIRKL